MKTLVILFFFTIAATIIPPRNLSAQSRRLPEQGYQFNFKGNPFDSLPNYLKNIRPFRSKDPEFFSPNRNGERYYLNIIPPSQKATRLDHSHIWLLKDEVAASWH